MSPPHPRNITDTPVDQPAEGAIQRWEFNDLRDTVKRIELALVGKNHMAPDPDALAGKVQQHDRDISQAKWLSRTAIAGVLAAGASWAWGKITSQH